jgi:peptidyl-prolyl cis-trans isomerase C
MVIKFKQFAQFTQFKYDTINYINYVNFLLFTLCSLLIFLGGCASLPQREDILAVVNGETITKDDFKYSLQIAHRREDFSHAGSIDIAKFVQKLVDDTLIIQEARRMGMEGYPEVKQALQAYILRESVVRLHDEEIVQKVKITQEDIMSYYKKNYERFSLGIIEANSEENAREILEQLKKGGDLSERGGREVVLNRNSIIPQIWKALSNLKPGEFSDIIPIMNKYYIVKLIGREEAPDEELEKVKESVEKAVRKQKEKERSDEYLKCLRELATIKINHELLSDLRLPVGSQDKETLLKDKRILAGVNGSSLTIGDFVAKSISFLKKSKEEILDDWIDLKIVDHEALSRHYEKSDLKDMVQRYENQLLKNTFTKKVIIPQITISEKTLKEYYANHQEKFTKPVRFKIQQITVKTRDEAQDILNNLQRGADFSWLAKKRSIDSANEKGGDIGWLTEAQILKPVREILDTLKPGNISGIIKIDSHYRIIRLQDRKEGEVEDFDKVKNAVYKACFEEQLNSIFNKYVSELKKDSEIKINDETVRLLEKRLQK